MTEYKEFQDLLESDDELPYTYNETTDVRAYQNDNRFESIDFPWLTKTSINLAQESNNKLCQETPKIAFTPDNNKSKVKDKESQLFKDDKSEQPGRILVQKGVLNKKDLISLKCMAAESNHNHLLWFINFLKYKDMQSDYKYLRSCLVGDIQHHGDYHMHIRSTEKIEFRYDIIVT